MTTETVNYRRERVTRGWLDLCLDAEAGGWRLAWTPDFGEPDWPGHMYSPEDDDLPSDYPDPADSDALVEWGQKTLRPLTFAHSPVFRNDPGPQGQVRSFTYRDLPPHQAA